MTEKNSSDRSAGADDAENPPAPAPDLRRGVRTDFGVRVERDLTGSSNFLARGSKTHYSQISFRLNGRPHDDEPGAAEPPVAAAPKAESVQAATPAVQDEAPPQNADQEIAPAPEGPQGWLGSLRRFWGG